MHLRNSARVIGVGMGNQPVVSHESDQPLKLRKSSCGVVVQYSHAVATPHRLHLCHHAPALAVPVHDFSNNKPPAYSFAMLTSLVVSGRWAEAAISFRYSSTGRPPPSPILDVDLVDDHERRVHGLVQDVKKKLAHVLDQPCLLFTRHASVFRKRPFPHDLNVYDRHRTSPAGFVVDSWLDCRSSGPGHLSILAITGALAIVDDADSRSVIIAAFFKKQDRVDDILNFSHASDWMQLRKELMRFGSKHRRLHDAGSNGVKDHLLANSDRLKPL